MLIKVGPLTNVSQTQCFSLSNRRLAASFNVFPLPINWNYVFSHLGFDQNRTIYVTILCVSIIYFFLMIYARIEDEKDRQRVNRVFEKIDNSLEKSFGLNLDWIDRFNG